MNETHIIKDVKGLSIDDKKIMKDSWQFFIYIGNKNIAFIYGNNIVDFPKMIQELIKVVVKITGKLYDIPGMS